MKSNIPYIDRLHIHIVYHWILRKHSISCIVETCCCLATASTSLNCCKARLVTNDFNFVCVHIINRTIEVTTNEIIPITNRKMSIV